MCLLLAVSCCPDWAIPQLLKAQPGLMLMPSVQLVSVHACAVVFTRLSHVVNISSMLFLVSHFIHTVKPVRDFFGVITAVHVQSGCTRPVV